MKAYCKFEVESNLEPPRILGLTATIIRGNSSVSKIPSEIQNIQSLFRAKAVTYKDYEEVLKYVFHYW